MWVLGVNCAHSSVFYTVGKLQIQEQAEPTSSWAHLKIFTRMNRVIRKFVVSTCDVFIPLVTPSVFKLSSCSLLPFFFLIFSKSGFSMCLVKGPGSSTGPQKKSVRLRNTDLPVLAQKRWTRTTESLDVGSSETEGNKCYSYIVFILHYYNGLDCNP